MSVNDSLGFLISNTARKLNHQLAQRFQPYDITPEQWSLLHKLSEQDGITQKELACRIDKDPANVTRILDQLERKGLIRRAAKEGDRRCFLTYLTDNGRTLGERLAPLEEAFVSDILSELPADDAAALRRSLIAIGEFLEREKR